MSDQNDASYLPEQEPGQASEPQAGGEPQLVTVDQLKEFSKQQLEEIKRLVQSLTDKQESRVEKRLKEWETRVVGQGGVVSDDLRKRARDELALQELRTMGEGDMPAQASSSPGIDTVPQEVLDKVIARRVQLEADYGGALTPDDPEFDEVNFDYNPRDPQGERFLKTFEKKLQEKQARLGASKLPPNPARGSVPTGIGGNQVEQLNKRLHEIQKLDPHRLNRTLTDERDKILRDMEALG